MDHHFLNELLLLLAVATAGVVIFERLRLPSIAGFLVVGALMGPGVLGAIDDVERVQSLAELGVVFLLFEIGIEMPVERLRRLWRSSLVVGGLQVTLTLAAVAGIGVLFGLDPRRAALLGALVAMSSTALVMGLLVQRGEIDSPQGQLAVGILLFQDLCVVPFLLAVPLLAASDGVGGTELAVSVGRAAVALVLFGLAARFVLPPILDRVARARSRELFTMVAFLAVMGSAVIAAEIGLTLAVGAFIGGLVLSASPYSHQLFAEVVPLRGVLLGTFFTAVGMLFDPVAAAAQWPLLIVYTVGVIALKAGFIAAIVAFTLRLGLRLGVLTGLALAQTGEFSFVLAAVAGDAGLLDAELRQVFVGGSIITLVLTPFLFEWAPALAARVSRGRQRPTIEAEDEPQSELRDHVALAGFGLAGQNVARVLRARGIPYRAVDANAASVSDSLERGEPVIYGDAARRSILERVGVARARLVVVALADPLATREVVALARELAPEVPVLARTRYVLDVDELAQAGANTVVVEELESTLELVAGVLRNFSVPEESVSRFAAELRDEGYVFLRTPREILDPWLVDLLEEVATEWVEVPHDFEHETTLVELAVRQSTGASVVALERAGTTQVSPDPHRSVRAGDRLLALGGPEAIERLRRLLAAGRAEPGDSSPAD